MQNGQVETALEQAEAWLVGAQNPDGSFGTLSELAPLDSALSVLAVHGDAAAESAVVQAAVYLQGVAEANTHFRSQRALVLAATGGSFQPLLDSLLDWSTLGWRGSIFTRYGLQNNERTVVAHELSHGFGFNDHVRIPGRLMTTCGSGERLSAQESVRIRFYSQLLR